MEIEIKVRLENSNNLKEFLIKNAEEQYTNQQIDEYFTPPYKQFTDVEPVVEWLRLRQSGDKCSINYKNWIYNDAGKSNHCDEFETAIDSIQQMRKIFTALDFVHLITVNKTRTVWNYQDYEVSFDVVVGLGDFVEIEYKGIEGVDPKEITDGMLDFINNIDCGQVTRDFRGYPYLLMEQAGLLSLYENA